MVTMRHKMQHGFSLVSAIFLLVVIAALGTFAVTLSTTRQQSAALDVLGARLSSGAGRDRVGGVSGAASICGSLRHRLSGRRDRSGGCPFAEYAGRF
jgi:autotransporter translocation and assembly factor TamB